MAKYEPSGGGGGGGAVSSVFGRIGAVVATLGDYAAQLISYAGSVSGAANVKAALDSLQAQVSALGGIAPLEIVESVTTGDWVSDPGDQWVRQLAAGAYIECDFAAWTAGDILRTSFWVNVKDAGGPSPVEVAFQTSVSLDGGATWQILLPAVSAVQYDFSVAEPIKFTCAASVSIAAATSPKVRVGYQIFNGLVGINYGDHENGVVLRCERYKAGSYTPAGSLV